jgi:hypothetical protein
MSLKDVAIVGVYATEQARQHPGRTSLDLALEAIHGAVADAKLSIDDVDGIAAEWPGPGGLPRHDGASWARVLGHPMAWTSDGLFDNCRTVLCRRCRRRPGRPPGRLGAHRLW